MTQLSVVRQQPIYPGLLGVPGSDVSRGLRWRSSGIVLYVDQDHPNATAAADGTDPENPLTTITAAFARLAAFHALPGISAVGSTIVIAGQIYTESIAVDQASYPAYVTILGAGPGRYPVVWAPATAAQDCLTIDEYGWTVDGIHFLPGATGASVVLTRNAGAGAEGTVVQNCFFNGGWASGGDGIVLSGAPANVSILNNRFAEFAATGPCIDVTATGTADPYQTHIIGNTFQESGVYIASTAGGWNASIIRDNTFTDSSGDDALPLTTTFIDLGNGSLGWNTVTQNIFPGTYSVAGGYTSEAGGLDNWNGNYAADVTPAQVGDNGLTIAEPV